MNEPLGESPPVRGKKRIPALGWVGIGCGGLLIVAIVAVSLLVGWCKRTIGDFSEFQKNPEKAAAEMVVRLSPDLDMVSQDEAAGEMTVRTKDGREMTLSYRDIAEGKFRVTGADGSTMEIGSADLSKLPAWVPRVAHLESVTSSFHTETDGKAGGSYSATTPLGADAAEEAFKEAVSSLGFTTSNRSAHNVNGSETRALAYEGKGRRVQILITSSSAEPTLVNVAYEER